MPGKFAGKYINDLSDAELHQAYRALSNVVADWKAKLKGEKFDRKFARQPPPTLNPSFQAILDEIDQAYETRNLKKPELK